MPRAVVRPLADRVVSIRTSEYIDPCFFITKRMMSSVFDESAGFTFFNNLVRCRSLCHILSLSLFVFV